MLVRITRDEHSLSVQLVDWSFNTPEFLGTSTLTNSGSCTALTPNGCDTISPENGTSTTNYQDRLRLIPITQTVEGDWKASG